MFLYKYSFGMVWEYLGTRDGKYFSYKLWNKCYHKSCMMFFKEVNNTFHIRNQYPYYFKYLVWMKQRWMIKSIFSMGAHKCSFILSFILLYYHSTLSSTVFSVTVTCLFLSVFSLSFDLVYMYRQISLKKDM